MQPQIEIRDIRSSAEIHLVEDLQKDVWGLPDIEVVPLTQLTAAIYAGGVLLGAFDGSDLVGFAYGFAAIEDGRKAHHSHMLAVLPEYRQHDLGFRLKIAQRERVLGQGIDLMSWTFDPLQSVNAYFNFSKLGVTSEKYFVDLYGSDAASFLHQNGTDRLWVSWELTSERVLERIRKEASLRMWDEVPFLVTCHEDDRPILGDLDECLSGDLAMIEIPADIAMIESEDNEKASEWRGATRNAFQAAITNGFIVDDFYREPAADARVGRYLLRKKVVQT